MDVKWIVAVSLCCFVASAQKPPEPARHLPDALISILADVKAKSHLNVLLPSQLPEPFANAKYATVESASENQYSILLYYRRNVGNSGFAGSFSAETHPVYRPNDLPNVRKVRLSNGIVGYFGEVTCGGSCAPAKLWWSEGHVSYSLQLKLRSNLPYNVQQEEMTAVVNSAILAGPR